MANEIELKLAFPATALAEILAHPLLAQAPRKGAPRVLDNSYFDTAELTLHAARIAVRTRRMGDTVLQTVKCAAESRGGLSSRPEWEQPFQSTFDFAAVDIKPVRKMLEALAAQLQPVFTTVFHRDTRIVQPVPEVSILVMIDTGKIIAGKAEEAICELELELAQGGADDLINLAIVLAEDLPLIPFDLSKAQRGYQLFLHTPPQAVRFSKPPLDAAHTPLQVFKQLAVIAEDAWVANLHGTLGSGDPEFVHQLRVTLRRLKTLLKVFKPVLPADFVLRWKTHLSELARVSGRARDLDVLREEILAPLRCSESASDIDALFEHSLRECALQQQAARTELAGMPHGLRLLHFNKALHRLPEPAKPGKLPDFAAKRLNKLHATARRRLAAVDQNPTPEMRHRLRISLKHLRYTSEFFASLFNEDEMNRFAKNIAARQDELGFLQDLQTTLDCLERWSAHDPALLQARERVSDWYGDKAEKTVKQAGELLATQLSARPPWQKP